MQEMSASGKFLEVHDIRYGQMVHTIINAILAYNYLQ